MKLAHIVRNDVPSLVRAYYANDTAMLFYWWAPDRLVTSTKSQLVRLPTYNRSQWNSLGDLVVSVSLRPLSFSLCSQSHTHIHPLSLVLVVMMKSKELKICSLAHSLILSLCSLSTDSLNLCRIMLVVMMRSKEIKTSRSILMLFLRFSLSSSFSS